MSYFLFTVHGGPSGRGQPFVDIEIRFAHPIVRHILSLLFTSMPYLECEGLQHRPLVLEHVVSEEAAHVGGVDSLHY